MANRPTLDRLEEFNKDPSAFNASKLVGVPVLLAVLAQHKEPYPHELLDVCKWLHLRGHTILLQLIKHAPEEPSTIVEEDWCKVFVLNIVLACSHSHSTQFC